MARRFSHVLGIDIGSDATKIVELRLGRAGVELIGGPVVFKTPPHTVQGGVVVEPQAVGAAIKEHLGGFGTKKVICSVGGQSSIVVRISEMPQMSASDLKEAIQWELERQTTFPPDQIIYDYCVIERPDTPADAPNMEVLLAAAHEDLVNAHVETLHAAGLQPVGIDIEPLALSRAIVEVYGDQYADQTVAIINIGNNLTDIAIIRRGLLSFVRSIPTAGEGLTRSISQAFVVDTDEAERIKRQHARVDGEIGGAYPPPAPAVAVGPDTGSLDLGTPAPAPATTGREDDTEAPVFELSSADQMGSAGDFEPTSERVTHLELDEAPVPPPPAPSVTSGGPPRPDVVDATAQQIYDAIAPILGELTTELRRSLDFYRRQHRNEPIDRLVLAGGSALLPGITEFVAADLGIPTETANPFGAVVQVNDVAPEYLRDVAPLCAIAAGLAMRDMIPE
ncbi:MAG: type IV pilus assembly protein PilM [Candidatus Zipacnadales bacterium]